MIERLLCLSLLRAGDALVQLPAIANLRAPERELHLLLQPVAKPAAELLSPFAQVHFLERNFSGGPFELSELAPNLPRFDRVLNLTLTRPAAELAERLAMDRAEGIVLRGGKACFTNPWLQLLNDWGVCAPLSVVHYGDIFSRAVCATPHPIQLIHSEESLAWWARERKNISGNTPLIFLQLSTSEAKKSYPRAHFLELVRALNQSHPALAIFALASPAERGPVLEFCNASNGSVRPLDCTFAQAACAFRDARLVISGDTALVHLAALSGARVLLLSSGSSAFRELGPIGAGHTVLHANYPCAPCKHDAGCAVRGDGIYPCTEAVSPLYAAEVASALLNNESPPPPGSSLVSIYASAATPQGLVTYTNLATPTPVDLCTALLRAHLLEQPGLLGSADAAEEPPRKLLPAERAALVSMAALIDALVVRARSGDRAPIDAALQSTREFMLLEMAKHLSGRVMSGPTERLPALLEELDALHRRIQRAL